MWIAFVPGFRLAPYSVLSDPATEREWAAIAQERIRQIESGEVAPLDGEQVLKETASASEAVGSTVSFQLQSPVASSCD